MHFFISFKALENDVCLPFHYNHIVQSLIYNSIEPELASFLHEKGFVHQKRLFKLFSFSNLRGRYAIDRERGLICFQEKVDLVVSSPVEEFCQSLVNTLLTKNTVRIGAADVQVEKIFVNKYPVPGENISIYTLSPVVLYSTLLRPDGGKYTCYYQPGDPDYNRLISENLRNKYRAYHGTEPPAGEVKVKALGRQRFHVLYYKDTVIKGYTGRLQLCGPAELLQLAVDAGLGGKNSQGFGCVKLLS